MCDEMAPGLKAYEQRWELEVTFRFYENILELDETQVHDDMSIIGTEFMNILSILMTYRLKKTFAKTAGWMRKYLEMTVDEDDCMRIEYRQNAMSFFRNRAGMFVMLTPDADWETVMTSYDARNNVELAFDIMKSELDGKRMRTGYPVRARGRFLVKFIALMIRVSMQNTIADSSIKGLTVENALLSAATYKMIDENGLRVRTEKTKKVREIFRLFGVDDPDSINGLSS